MAHIDDMRTQKANLGYIRGAMDEPMLERGHELDLARRWRDKGDQKALHELVKSYMRLVIAMASRHNHNVRSVIRGQLRGDALVFVGVDVAGVREALAVGIAFAIVGDHHVKSGKAGDFIQAPGHVP